MEIIVPAIPDDVYDAFMDPQKHAVFTEEMASGSEEPGGLFSAYGGYISAKNIKLVRGSKIVQEWTTSEWPQGAIPSILTITLKAIPEGTELIMDHSLVPIEQADDYEEGWKEHYWDKLVRYFQRNKKKK
jgi:activator of HSP90 ATPase